MYAKPRHIKAGWGKYCSKKCQNQAQRNGVFVPCAFCEEKVYRTKSDSEHSKSGFFFCGKSCLAKWKNQNVIIGEKHPSWKHGENAYRNIMKRKGGKAVCIGCGITKFEILLVHHKDRNRKNNRIDNLVWLCHNCHFLEHRYDNRRKTNSMEALV